MNKIKEYFTEHKNAFVLAIIVLVVILAVIARFALGIVTNMIKSKMMAQMMIPSVTLEEIKEEGVLESFEAPGRVVPKYSVDLIARVSGYLQLSHFKEGDFVKKGQVLFTIEQREYINALNQAEAELKSAQAQAKKAEVDFKRAKELVDKDFISKSAYDDRLAQRDIARANLQAAKARVDDAKRNLSYTKIVAPTDGRIGYLQITEGNYVNASSGAIAKIISVDPIFVQYSLDSKQFNELRGDEIISKNDKPFEVEVELADGTKYNRRGTQDFFDNEISESTGAIALRATFDNPDGILITGDFVKVKVYSNTIKTKTVVPQSAVLQDASGRYVYTLTSDKNKQSDGLAKAKLVRIKVSGQYNDKWIVEEGLKPGDVIVKDGALKLTDGIEVKIITQEEYKQLELEEKKAIEEAKDKENE